MTDLSGNIFFDGPAGRIEGLIKEGPGKVTRAAVVCHPHPLFGGTMHNKVVFRLARVLNESGFAVLRFNFRGVGRSQGEHDQGVGEKEDLLAAIDFVTNRYPGAELLLAGFSFGAMVMWPMACEEERAKALIAAGFPVSRYVFDPAIACVKPKLFVQGELDQFGEPEDLRRFVEALSGPKQLEIVEGADHFFEGRLSRLTEIVAAFVSEHFPLVEQR
ncbi:MAG: alpha/beta hydrolase [Blastocatellia bacterium AA13]|nr:MAG: alpha/beta hydrolase [Blastocatellia bacterium AA13]